MKKALLLIDLQNDFLPGGALAVEHGDEVIPVANEWMAKKAKEFDFVFASQDWHPKNHGSFSSNQPGTHIGQMGSLNGRPQVMWPDHCVQSTTGADFASDLQLSMIDQVIQKGTDSNIDSYSAFFDNGHLKQTELGRLLKSNHVTHLHILGLATDYCVKFTVLDALALGYGVSVIKSGCRAVNLQPGDGDLAFQEMLKNGATILNR